MPTFTEISVEELAKIKGDHTDVYRPFIAAGRGVLTVGKDEIPEEVKKYMNRAAKKMGGLKVKFYTDKAKPARLVYEVIGNSNTASLTAISNQVNTQNGSSVTTEPVYVPGVSVGAIPPREDIDLPEEFEDVQKPAESEIPSFAPPVFNPPVEAPRQIPLPQNNVPATEVPQTPTSEAPKRKRRTKVQIAADEAAKNQSQVTMTATPEELAPPAPIQGGFAPPPAPVAIGTVFEGHATEEHPLVASEKAAGATFSRICPRCEQSYALAKICPQCGTQTVEAPLYRDGVKQEVPA